MTEPLGEAFSLCSTGVVQTGTSSIAARVVRIIAAPMPRPSVKAGEEDLLHVEPRVLREADKALRERGSNGTPTPER